MLFISHSTKDKKFAHHIHRWLLSQGYIESQIFLDSDADSGIKAGALWKESLHSGLKNCTAIIVLFSNNWRTSDWCSYELGHARATGKPIFPVLVEDIPVAGMTAEYQAVRYWKNSDDACERLWESLQEQHLGPRDTFLWPHPALKGDLCPYPGLPAFDERYAAVYFGREPEIKENLDLLRKMRNEGEPRLLMIGGGSGSGKSSLLKAGVLPRLGAPDWVVLPTLRFSASNEDHTIFDQLARDLAALFPDDAKNRPEWRALRDSLKANQVAAAEFFFETAQDLTMALNQENATVLLAIDQFEELLSPAATDIAKQFLGFLQAVFARKNGRLLAIGTIRSDYVDVYEKDPHYLKPTLICPWPLRPFPRERIRDVIAKPAERTHVTLTPELLAQLQKDTPTAEALPLLAFTLEKLYRRYAADSLLELMEYHELGGMEGAIQKSIERIVPSSLPKEQLSALRWSFVKHLAQVDEKGQVVRLTARWSDLPALAKPFLEAMVQDRLLVRSENNQIEVAHEAMFRAWPTLKAWLRDSSEVMHWRREVRRDQTADKKWSGLRPAQLAKARDWPRSRREELDDTEIRWINAGVRSQWLSRASIIAVFLIISSLGIWANHQRKRIVLSSQSEEKQKYLASTTLAEREWSNNNPTRAKEILNQSPKRLRSWEFCYLKQLLSLGETKKTDHQSEIYYMAQDKKNGKFAATAGLEPGIKIWDLDKLGMEEGKDISLEERVVSLDFAPCSSVLAFATRTRLFLIDPDTNVPHSLLKEGLAEVSGVAFLDSKRLAVGMGKEIQILNLDTKELVPNALRKHDHNITCVAATHTGYVATSSGGGMVTLLWNVDRDDPPIKIEGHKQKVTSLAFSPNGEWLASGSFDWTVRVWNVSTGTEYKCLQGHQAEVTTVAFNHRGDRIASGGWDHSIRLWRFEKSQQASATLRGHDSVVTGLSFHPTQRRVTAVGWDKTIRIWDAERDRESTLVAADSIAAPERGSIEAVGALEDTSSPPRLTILSKDENGGIQVCKLDDKPAQIKFISEGKKFRFGRSRGRITRGQAAGSDLLDPLNWDFDLQLPGWDKRGEIVEVSRDGKLVLVASPGGGWQLFALPSLEKVGESQGDLATISEDGRWLASIHAGDDIRIREISTGIERKVEGKQHTNSVLDLEFSPSGKYLATASSDYSIKLWETKSSKLHHDLKGHYCQVNSIGFNPKGDRIVSGSEDKTARLWDVESGKLIFVLPGVNKDTKAVAFSTAGNAIIAGFKDGTVQVWRASADLSDVK